jgi:hypothetical protein
MAILNYNINEEQEAIQNHLKQWLEVVSLSMKQLFLIPFEQSKLLTTLQNSPDLTYWNIPRISQSDKNWSILNQFFATKEGQAVCSYAPCKFRGTGLVSSYFSEKNLILQNKCSRCKTNAYCSKLHQILDWKGHKITCKPPN